MRITVTLHRIVPRHLILQRIVLLILPSQNQVNYKNIKPLLAFWENQKGYYRGDAHAAIHLSTTNQFLKLVYLHK